MGDLLKEIIASKPLSDQAAIDVWYGGDNGINCAGADLGRQLFQIHNCYAST
jgi:hypothetical protein